jgi:hypothetical protein
MPGMTDTENVLSVGKHFLKQIDSQYVQRILYHQTESPGVIEIRLSYPLHRVCIVDWNVNAVSLAIQCVGGKREVLTPDIVIYNTGTIFRAGSALVFERVFRDQEIARITTQDTGR